MQIAGMKVEEGSTATPYVDTTNIYHLKANWYVNNYTITVKAGTGIESLTLAGWEGTGSDTLTKSIAYSSTLDLSAFNRTYKNGYGGVKYTKTSGSGSVAGSNYTVGASDATITISAGTITNPASPVVSPSSTTTISGTSATFTCNSTTVYDSSINVNYQFYPCDMSLSIFMLKFYNIFSKKRLKYL